MSILISHDIKLKILDQRLGFSIIVPVTYKDKSQSFI